MTRVQGNDIFDASAKMTAGSMMSTNVTVRSERVTGGKPTTICPGCGGSKLPARRHCRPSCEVRHLHRQRPLILPPFNIATLKAAAQAMFDGGVRRIAGSFALRTETANPAERQAVRIRC
jgi:hypothetical protein